MKTPSVLSLLLALAPILAFSHNLSVGQTSPSISIDTYGEMTLQGDDVAYQPWATQQMLGKVRVIQAIAGRSKAKERNAP
ncbi:YtfJ family protein, partial [Vibrio diabolicus]